MGPSPNQGKFNSLELINPSKNYGFQPTLALSFGNSFPVSPRTVSKRGLIQTITVNSLFSYFIPCGVWEVIYIIEGFILGLGRKGKEIIRFFLRKKCYNDY